MNQVPKINDPRDLVSLYNVKYYTPIAMLMVTFLMMANITVQKLVPIGSNLILTAGDFIFPLVYIADSVLTEVYGYAASRKVIWMALFSNVLMALVISLAIALPGAKAWGYQDQFAAILGRTPQIVFASFVAFLSGEFINSYILAKLKIFTSGKWLWMRTTGSLMIGQGIDTIIFNIIAFFGVISFSAIFTLMIAVYCFKILYELLLLPIIYFIVKFLKRSENIDIYDRGTNFNPFYLR
jgi:queuosine precursor transporter